MKKLLSNCVSRGTFIKDYVKMFWIKLSTHSLEILPQREMFITVVHESFVVNLLNLYLVVMMIW